MYLLKIKGPCQFKTDARELVDKIILNQWSSLMVHPLASNKLSPDREMLSHPEHPIIEVRNAFFQDGNRFLGIELIFDIINSEDPPQKLMFDLSLKGFNVELYYISQDRLYFSSSYIKAGTDFSYQECSNPDIVREDSIGLLDDIPLMPFTERDLRFSEAENAALLRLLEVLDM